MTDYNNLKRLAKNYLKARHTFLTESKELPDLSGNDNIVGRIGELVAIQYLRNQGRTVIKNLNPVEKGYDLKTDKEEQISVKIITAENKRGRTTRIKQPWTELIFIKLNHLYEVDTIGHITKTAFSKALEDGILKTQEPYTDIKLLADNGLFDLYGERKTGKDVTDYL